MDVETQEEQVLCAQQEYREAEFTLDGHVLDVIHCVASVMRIREAERMYVLEVEDGSEGRVRVYLWKRKEMAESVELVENGTIRESMYIRIFGRISGGKSARSNMINAKKINPIGPDLHEPFYHMLHCIYVTMKFDESRQKKGDSLANSMENSTIKPALQVAGPSGDSEEIRDSKHSPPFPSPPPSSIESEDASPSPPCRGYASAPECLDTPVQFHYKLRDVASSPALSSTSRKNSKMPKYEFAAHFQHRVPFLSHVQNSYSYNSIKTQKNGLTDPLSNLTTLERDIVLCILSRRSDLKDEDNWEGVNVVDIARQVQSRHGQISAHELSLALDSLVDGGQIHPTVDELNYSVCSLP
ncbi:hypothetical protein EW145_g6085 [Phellinidium pouzarii]|uniref:Replication protein A C-terminal domain-containing protein n=1 Tax=Phellinidium pouzarii TaxID=167371 RepID=A0A4S4L2J2_9AGAM|nr:hypothetical protein EW145_g6085 [Phellinidium pouzarii]